MDGLTTDNDSYKVEVVAWFLPKTIYILFLFVYICLQVRVFVSVNRRDILAKCLQQMLASFSTARRTTGGCRLLLLQFIYECMCIYIFSLFCLTSQNRMKKANPKCSSLYDEQTYSFIRLELGVFSDAVRQSICTKA